MAIVRWRRLGHEVRAARSDHGRQLQRARTCLALALCRYASAARERAGNLARPRPDGLRPARGGQARPLGDPTEHRASVGDPADDRRRPVSGHTAVSSGGDRCPHRGNALGLQPTCLRGGQPTAPRAVESPGGGLLGAWRRGAGRLGHRRWLVDRRRREDRAAGHRLRRQRACQPRRRPAQGPREPQPVATAVPLTAAGGGRPGHRRLLGTRLPLDEGKRTGVRTRLRHADRAAPLGLPQRTAERRCVRCRHLAERVVALLGQHEHLGEHHGGPRARLRLSGHEHADLGLLRWPSSGRQPVCREPGLRRPRDGSAGLALPVGASRRLGLRQPDRAEPARHHR